jgi:hypothetical protein
MFKISLPWVPWKEFTRLSEVATGRAVTIISSGLLNDFYISKASTMFLYSFTLSLL